jgi:hypothetical protein
MNPTKETKGNRYIFLEDPGPQVEIKTIVTNPSTSAEISVKVMPIWLTDDAMELIKEAEASVLDRYDKDKNTNPEDKKMWDKHTELVDELMANVRRYLKP